MNGGVRAGAGRPPGAKNKLNLQAQEAIALVFEELGGPDALQAWVKADPANERLFYGTIYPKLIAQTVRHGGDPDGVPIKTRGVIDLVRPGQVAVS